MFSHVVWGDHKPRTFLRNVFNYITLPIAFGHLGASIDFKVIDLDIFLKALTLFLVSDFIWFFSTVFITFIGRLKIKDSIFVGICWMPKGVLTGACAYSVETFIEMFMEEGDLKITYKRFADIMKLSALFTLLLTTPIGYCLEHLL